MFYCKNQVTTKEVLIYIAIKSGKENYTLFPALTCNLHSSYFDLIVGTVLRVAPLIWAFLSLFRISLRLRFLCSHLAQQVFFLMMQLFNHSFSADEEIFLHML